MSKHHFTPELVTPEQSAAPEQSAPEQSAPEPTAPEPTAPEPTAPEPTAIIIPAPVPAPVPTPVDLAAITAAILRGDEREATSLSLAAARAAATQVAATQTAEKTRVEGIAAQLLTAGIRGWIILLPITGNAEVSSTRFTPSSPSTNATASNGRGRPASENATSAMAQRAKIYSEYSEGYKVDDLAATYGVKSPQIYLAIRTYRQENGIKK